MGLCCSLDSYCSMYGKKMFFNSDIMHLVGQGSSTQKILKFFAAFVPKVIFHQMLVPKKVPSQQNGSKHRRVRNGPDVTEISEGLHRQSSPAIGTFALETPGGQGVGGFDPLTMEMGKRYDQMIQKLYKQVKHSKTKHLNNKNPSILDHFWFLSCSFLLWERCALAKNISRM